MHAAAKFLFSDECSVEFKDIRHNYFQMETAADWCVNVF